MSWLFTSWTARERADRLSFCAWASCPPPPTRSVTSVCAPTTADPSLAVDDGTARELHAAVLSVAAAEPVAVISTFRSRTAAFHARGLG